MRKPGLEGAVDHALAVDFEDAGGGETAHEGVADAGRVGAGLAGEGEGLGDGGDVGGDDHLVGDLADLTGAGVADMGDVLAHELEQGEGAVEGGFAAAGHDREARGLGADFAAGDGSVEPVAAGFLDGFGEGRGGGGADGRHVDHEAAGLQAGADALGGVEDGVDVRRVGQHEDDDVGGGGDGLRRVEHLGAGGDLGREGGAAGDKEGVAGVLEVHGHGAAHDAEADKSDVHKGAPVLVGCWADATQRARPVREGAADGRGGAAMMNVGSLDYCTQSPLLGLGRPRMGGRRGCRCSSTTGSCRTCSAGWTGRIWWRMGCRGWPGSRSRFRGRCGWRIGWMCGSRRGLGWRSRRARSTGSGCGRCWRESTRRSGGWSSGR